MVEKWGRRFIVNALINWIMDFVYRMHVPITKSSLKNQSLLTQSICFIFYSILNEVLQLLLRPKPS